MGSRLWGIRSWFKNILITSLKNMDKNNTTYSEIIIFFIIFVTIVFLTYKVYQNESYLNHVSDKNQETYNKLTWLRIKTEDNTKHIQSLMESTYSEQLDEARDLMYYAGFDTEEFEAIREIRAYGLWNFLWFISYHFGLPQSAKSTSASHFTYADATSWFCIFRKLQK